MYYRGVLNAIALGQLVKEPDMPEARLAIGDAEVTRSLPTLPAYAPQVRQAALPQVRTMDDLNRENSGGPLTDKDFPTGFYLGQGVG